VCFRAKLAIRLSSHLAIQLISYLAIQHFLLLPFDLHLSPSLVIPVLDTGIHSLYWKYLWMQDQVRHDFPEGMDAGSPREIDVLISQGGMTF